MKGYITNIEETVKDNKSYRRVLYTGKNSQLVVMTIRPGDEVGEEVHEADQFVRFEAGAGKVIISGLDYPVEANYAIFIPQGAAHNIINTGSADLKFYTLYSPPEHRDGTVHVTKTEAGADNEHFDGNTTEK